MSEENNQKFIEFLKKILRKLKPRFSFHYVAYTTLFLLVIFSTIKLVGAVTPNPGHGWNEVGDGTFVVSGPTLSRTYTFPDANATILTTNAAVTVAQGGTGQTSIAAGSVWAANSANTLSAVNSTTGTKVLTNTTGTITWEVPASGMTWPAGGAGIPNYSGSSSWGTSYTTNGSGTVLALITSPSFTTPSLGVATATSINNLSLSQDNTDLNIKIGENAGFNIVSGAISNTFVGHGAGRSASGTSTNAADYNTAIGYRAFYVNATGNSNTAIGDQSLYSSIDGSNNIALGYNSGRYITGGATANTTSDFSVYLGTATKAGADNNQNEIVIGYDTTGNGSNTATIGNTSLLRTYLTGVNLKAGTATAGTAPLKLTAGTNLSTTEAGAIEYDGSHLYFTAANAGTRYQLDQQGGGASWDTIGDPSGNGAIAMGSTVQTMDWATATTTNPLTLNAPALTTGKLLSLASNTLTSGTLLDITSAGTGALTNQKGLNIALSGTNGTAAQTTYGAYISNTHAGTTSTNVGLYATASGGTTANYAAQFDGNLNFTAGASRTISVGNSSSSANNLLNINSGTGLSGATGGAINITAGNGDIGGEINITAGNGLSTLGGNLTLASGSGDGGSGNIIFRQTTQKMIISTTGVNVGSDTTPDNYFSVGTNSQFQVTSSGAIAAITGYTQGSGTMSLTSANTTQTTTGSAFAGNFNSLTTGTGMYLASASLTSGTLLDLTSNGTGALTNQKGLNIALSGTNGTAAQTTYGAYISNTHAGTTSTNVGLYASATGGTTANYAAIFDQGNVGIGTTGPIAKLSLAGQNSANNYANFLSGNSSSTYNSVKIRLTDNGVDNFGYSDLGMNPEEGINLENSNIGHTIFSSINVTSSQVMMGNQYGNFFSGQNFGGGQIIVLGDNSSTGNDTLLTIDDVSRKFVFEGSNVGIGQITPTAVLHIKAGTATAGTAPLKFTSGTNLTTAEAGAMEWNGTNLFMTQTTGPTRKTIAYTTDIPSLSGYVPYTGATGDVSLGNYDLTAGSIYLGEASGDSTISGPGGDMIQYIDSTGYFGFGGGNINILNSNVGIGAISTPTARLHLPAGTATAGTAPLKLTSGTALSAVEDGALEYHSSHLYFSIGSTRYQLDQQGGGGSWDTIGDPSGNGAIAFGSTVQTMDWGTATTQNALSLTGGALTTGKLLSLTSNTLTSGTLLDIISAGTAGLTNQKGLNIALSGTNGTAAQTTYGAYISNTHAGTTSTNVGLYATATGGTTANYAGMFEGNVVLNSQSDLRFADADSSNYVAFQAPATISSDVTWTLPSADASGCFKSNGSGTMSISACGDTNLQTFASNGNYTIPTDALMVIAEGWGGGGGGGAGYSGALGTIRSGGAGGGGGAYNTQTILASSLGTSGANIPVTIGGGGTASTTTLGAAMDGGGGQRTCLSSTSSCGGTVYLSAHGGGGGNGGSGTAGSGGGGGGGVQSAGATNGTQATYGPGGNPNSYSAVSGGSNSGGGGGHGATAAATGAAGGAAFWGGAGGASSSSTGAGNSGNGGGSYKGGSAGGAGGSIGTAYTQRLGGAGGTYLSGNGSGGAAGAATDGAAGGNGASDTNYIHGGQGGGGGTTSSATVGGAGGNGGVPGGGGGGGGASNTTTVGSAGGAGGAGYMKIWTLRGSGADLAEVYGSNDNTITAGDVVALDKNMNAGVKKSEKAYDKDTIGVISTNPGLTIGNVEDAGATPVLVALSGRVPVKVNMENGPIEKGDYLTSSSVPGVAMKATKAGTIIGQAMTEYTDEEVPGFVVAFIKSGPSNGITLKEIIPGLTLLDEGGENVEGEEVNEENQDNEENDEIITPTETVQKVALTYFLANKIQLEQSTDISEIYTDRLSAALEIITPTVITDTLSTNSIVVSTGEIITFSSASEFIVPPIFNSDTAGFALIKKGDRKVRIDYDEPYIGDPVVSAGLSFNVLDEISDIFADDIFNEDLKSIIIDSDQNGFTIIINKEAPRDLRFSWTALSVRDPKIFESVIDGLIFEEEEIDNPPDNTQDENQSTGESDTNNSGTEVNINEESDNQENTSGETVQAEVTGNNGIVDENPTPDLEITEVIDEEVEEPSVIVGEENWEAIQNDPINVTETN